MVAVAHRERLDHEWLEPRAPAARSWGLWLCIAVALALRVLALVAIGHPELRRGQVFLSADEPSFHRTAEALATTGRYSERPGGSPTAFRPPGLVLPLAALYRLVRPSPFVAF